MPGGGRHPRASDEGICSHFVAFFISFNVTYILIYNCLIIKKKIKR